jgi:hypothetical protein
MHKGIWQPGHLDYFWHISKSASANRVLSLKMSLSVCLLLSLAQVLLKPQMDPGVVTPGGRSIKEAARNTVSSVGVANLVTSSPPSTHDTQ